MKIDLLFFIVLALVSSLLSCSKNNTVNPALPSPASYQFESTPAWQDDFTGTSLNTTDWKLHAPGIRHDGYNDLTGTSFDGNNFINKVYTDTVNGTVTHHAGMIRTVQEFMYGKFEARVSFVNSSGSWSAFWMQSTDVGITNPVDPQTNGMEIDIVETLHNDGAAHHNLHWGGYGSYHQTAGYITGNLGINGGDYHIFTLEWTPVYYKFYVDGILTWTYSTHVSQHTEFIILSSEVENYATGSWAGPIPANGFGSLASTTTIMKVDYVKWYKLK